MRKKITRNTIRAKIRNSNHGGHRVTRSFNMKTIISSVKLRVLCGFYYS